MAEDKENSEEPVKKKSKLPHIIGLVLGIAGCGGGFYAVQSGLILGGESHAKDDQKASETVVADMPDVAFVPIEPMVVSLDSDKGSSHLRFRAQLEVNSPYKEEVEKLLPRVVDVLNTYLRAIDPAELERNSILVKLRAQMLRRIQIVTGGDRVNDLLIMEFVLN